LSKAKPFRISKRVVFEAYKRVRANQGAAGVARKRCWRCNWVVDLDIKGFFDNIDHGLLMRAVRKHTDSKWLLLYMERWLKAPVQAEDGTLVSREKGSPQGSVISPLLANCEIVDIYSWVLFIRK
jgi:RNA-directed DNA polymerase